MRPNSSSASRARDRFRRLGWCARCAIGIGRRRALLLRIVVVLICVLPLFLYIFRPGVTRAKLLDTLWPRSTNAGGMPSSRTKIRTAARGASTRSSSDASRERGMPDRLSFDYRIKAALDELGIHLPAGVTCLRTTGSLHSDSITHLPPFSLATITVYCLQSLVRGS